MISAWLAARDNRRKSDSVRAPYEIGERHVAVRYYSSPMMCLAEKNRLHGLGSKLFLIWLLPMATLACATLGQGPAPLTPTNVAAPATETPVSSVGEVTIESDGSPRLETAAPVAVAPSVSPGDGVVMDSVETIEAETPTPETSGPPTLLEILASAEPPERDDIELARLYKGWDGVIETVPLVEQPLPLGAVQEMNILNLDKYEPRPVEFELLAVGEHAYFWFETARSSLWPSEAALSSTAESLDQIYEQSVALFGPENNPGVDGDPRLHVVNAASTTMCDVCGTIGYFVATDALPIEVDPASNAREMFVMNDSYFGSDTYVGTLAHELRHLIEDNYDRGDADWEVEGSAELAEELAGFPGSGISLANLFLSEPDQQLNGRSESDALTHYGQGYLLNRYIYDRFGAEFFRQFAASPKTGLTWPP